MAEIMSPRLPSSKLLGYYQVPLRGRKAPAGRDLCVTTRRKRRAYDRLRRVLFLPPGEQARPSSGAASRHGADLSRLLGLLALAGIGKRRAR